MVYETVVNGKQYIYEMEEMSMSEYIPEKTDTPDIEAARQAFLHSNDFMKLGQAINRQNWQVAAMTAQRMQKCVQQLELDTFERQLANIRQCIIHKQGKQAKDILALMTAKRAQMLNR